MTSLFKKKTRVKLELLIDNDLSLMVEKGIRRGICQAVYRYAKANNKCMKNYDKNKDSSFLQYLDANNQYGWSMCEKMPVDGFKWIEKYDLLKFTEEFIKNKDKNSDIGYFLEVDVENPKSFYKVHSNLPFLPERIEINKCTKLICNVLNKRD